jgi:Ca2+-binding RTX toxin-like protein
MPRRRSVLGQLTRPRTWTLVAALACTGAAMLPTGARTDIVPDASAAPAPVGQGFVVVPSDLAFILKQIKIAERHARVLAGNEPTQGDNPHPTSDPMYCQSMIGNGPDQFPSPLLSFGLRTVDGSCNNLILGQDKYGAADQTFPRLTKPEFNAAEDSNIPGLGPVGPPGPTSYAQTSGSVVDSQPRTISNLIVDQTSTNPAAVAAAGFPVRSQGAEGVVPCTSPGVPVGCVPEHETLFMENITTDVGLSPPFNSLFTIFGQFFDHGLDKITNGGNGTVFVPLKDDDPLVAGPDHILGNGDDLPANLRFMTLSRGHIVTGADGFRNAPNTDTPFVDQSQTYTSHASHQIFLREYVNNVNGRPVSTGKFLSSADGDGMANWAEIKEQSATLLGLQLTDANVVNIPLLASDPYGNFIPGPARGLPQYVTSSGLVEGNTGAPVPVPADAQFTDTAFLNDIAHAAAPTFSSPGVLNPDTDSTAGGSLDTTSPAGSYDNELLDLHFICGDGRCNENIALTAVHQIFHSEHDRLIDAIKTTLVNDSAPGGSHVTNLVDWQSTLGADGWNGERLFQAARFVTEMQYQHLVFEEFARKVQPAINPFQPFAFNQTDVNPAITAEFAHAVYRFGHSMLTEDIPRLNSPESVAAGAPLHNDIPLLDGFLNPAAYTDSGDPAHPLTTREAATAIIMGLADQSGNEIDEFVTDTLRNNLLGLPLDLPSINMTRARSEGIPPLNEVRRQIFAATNDNQLIPYTNWIDFREHMKHPESLVNFVAAYGTHPTIASQTTLAGRRSAADQIVNGTILPGPDGQLVDDPGTVDVDESADNINPPADSGDFVFGDGAWANVDGKTVTGLDRVDLWVGGLAENTNLFGGLLGSTFNYVFENQLTNLQNGDRMYYLARTPGMNLRTQLEGNSFSELVMRNTSTHTLKADPFATADCKFEIGALTWPAAPGSALTGPGTVNDVAASDCDENVVLLRQPDGQIRYRAINQADPPGINGQGVYNGTSAVDRIYGGNDNDTIWGNESGDIIDGGGGDDVVLGGDGNDIMTDFAGADVPKGGPGNDAIDGGIGDDIIMAGTGDDFTNGGANINETFAGAGNDFVIAGAGEDAVFGDAGDDWEEGGDHPDLLQGEAGNLFFTDTGTAPGNDIFIGQGGDDDYDYEGGDDIGLAGPGIEKIAGAAGYDWQIGLSENQAQNMDLKLPLVGLDILTADLRDKFNEVEALSGWKFDDTLRGDDFIPADQAGAGFVGCDALDQNGVDRIAGLDALVPASIMTRDSAAIVAASAVGFCPLSGPAWGEGNILLGGSGSDLLEGRGANDILDGDRYVGVHLSIRTDPADPATETGTTDLMEHPALTGNFGPATTPGMTLQQAVFAGLLDPSHIVIVRELLDDAPATDNDVAAFSGPAEEYTVTANANGSLTVDHLAGAGADGIDTLWNIETLRFCDAVDAVTGACTAPVDVPATGTVVAPPAVSVAPTGTVAAPVQFGAVALNTGPTARTITVTNTGGGTLTVSAATIAGGQANQFAIVNDGCTGVPLGGNGACTIDVGFSPTALNPLAKVTTLTIATNAGNVPVTLRGTVAIIPQAQATVASPTDFGRRRVDEPRTKTVLVTNTGAANLTVTGLVFTGPFSGDLGTCNVAVPAGRTCKLNVTFTPAAPLGVKTGTVRLISNASNSNPTGALTGESRAAAVVVAALRIVQSPAPTSVKPVNVSLRVSTAASIRLQVRKTNGTLVWSKSVKARQAGTAKLKWNLRDAKGHRVKKGRYVFTITVTDGTGAKVVVKRTVRVR